MKISLFLAVILSISVPFSYADSDSCGKAKRSFEIESSSQHKTKSGVAAKCYSMASACNMDSSICKQPERSSSSKKHCTSDGAGGMWCDQ